MNISLILKGFVVGIGKILPGVSGSMLAITLGLYEDLLKAVTNFFLDVQKNIKLLGNFCLGLFLAIMLFSKAILFLLNNYYSETMFLFLGLIMGSSLPFIKEIKINKKNIWIFLIVLLIILFGGKIQVAEEFVFRGTLSHYLYIGVLGVIDAFTSIVPGISGTSIFMMLGSYQFVLGILGNPFCLLFVIYGIGVVGGIVVVCYLMYYLLKYFKNETYSAIFALMVGSLGVLFLTVQENLNVFTGLIFILGVFWGFLFDK